jgi:hypothetical protein
VKIPQGHEVTVYVNGDQQVQGLGAPAVPYETNEKAAPRPTITGKPMTNEDVLTLKAAGFGEDFIVSRIKVASPSFTLDTPDLVKLKQAGLSDAVIGAMVQAPGSPPTAPVPPTLDPAQAARGTTPALSAVEQGPEEPELSGIFYALDGSKLIPLERQDAAVQIGVGGVFVMNGKGVIKFAGAHSPVRIRYAQSLDFIVRSPADADRSLYHLRRLEIRKSDREVTVVSEHASPLGATVKANDQNIVSVGYSRYGTHSVRITATELQPGEYAIGAQGGKIVFCFGVD